MGSHRAPSPIGHDSGLFLSQKTEDPVKDRLMFGELNPCGGGDPIPLQKPRLVVGRQPSCDIILRFPNVSSRHCEFQLLNGYWHVRDLGSRNGIKVNGIRCDSHWLMPGDVLWVAKHRYEVNYSPEAEAPPPVEAEPDPLSISLLEKAGLSRRGAPESYHSQAPQEPRRNTPQRHSIGPSPTTMMTTSWTTTSSSGSTSRPGRCPARSPQSPRLAPQESAKAATYRGRDAGRCHRGAAGRRSAEC